MSGAGRAALLQRVLERLDVVRGPDRRGNFRCWCIFHPDHAGKNPNLDVHENGYICRNCGESGSLRALARELGVAKADGDRMRATYHVYENEDGSPRYRMGRTGSGSKKKIWQEHPDGSGGWKPGRNGIGLVLYKLPELARRPDEVVYLVEGETCVEALLAAGLLATTAPEGAAAPWLPQYTDVLRGREVVLLPDNDGRGARHMQKAAKALNGAAETIKILNLPGLNEKEDVIDWFAQQHSVEELRSLTDEDPLWCPQEPDHADGAEWRSLSEAAVSPLQLRQESPSLPESLLGDALLPSGGLMAISGPPSVGKTRALFSLACSLACGVPWLGLPTATGKKRVLVVALETPSAHLHALQASVLEADHYDIDALDEALRFITPDRLGRPFGSILDFDVREELVAYAQEFDLVALDPLYLIVPGSFSDDIVGKQTAEALADVRTRGNCAVAFLHHDRKASTSGHSGAALDRMFGSIFLHAALDLHIGISWKKRSEGTRKLEFGKVRYGVPPDGLCFRMTDEGIPVASDSDEGQGVSAEEVENVIVRAGCPISAREIGDELDGVHHRAIQRELKNLCHDQRVQAVGKGSATRYIATGSRHAGDRSRHRDRRHRDSRDRG